VSAASHVADANPAPTVGRRAGGRIAWAIPRAAFWSGALFLSIWLGGSCAVQVVTPPPKAGTVNWDARALAARLERGLTDADARFAQKFFPEGELFTWEFFGLALENIAEITRDPGDVDAAFTFGRKTLGKIDESYRHSQFDRMRDLPARGGVFFLSGRNLVLGRLIRLAPARATQEEVAAFHRDSQTLHDVFLGEPAAMPESYPGLRWPVDGVFGLESLKVHDDVYGTDLAVAPIRKWIGTLQAHLDRATGLMPSMVHEDGSARDMPRGCALSWTLAVLPRLAPTFASAQWAAYKKHFLVEEFGLSGFREYPPGHDRKADLDSGPIVYGIGMSATAFALAAARANGDRPLEARLLALGQGLGLPIASPFGKTYAGGAFAILDVFALWTQTMPLPAEPAAVPTPRPAAVDLVLTPWVALGLIAWSRLRRRVR
jgi:hypothetical protein